MDWTERGQKKAQHFDAHYTHFLRCLIPGYGGEGVPDEGWLTFLLR